MSAFAVLSGLVPLALVGGGIWLAVRLLTGGGRSERADPATVVRQIAQYGLLAITAFVLVGGIASLENELVPQRFDNFGLAQAMAILLIAAPALSVQAALVDRRLKRDPDEAHSVAWSGYLNVMLASGLIGSIVGLVPFLAALVDPEATVDRTDWVMAAAWLTLLGSHWVWMAVRGIRGDLHLGVGSIIAAWTLGAGNIGVGYLLFDRLYSAITDDPITERAGPSAATLSALFAIGVCAWLWYWLGRYEHADRTPTWYVTVVPAGALVGAVTAIVSGALVLYRLLTWFVGDPESGGAVRHFDDLPFLGAVLGTGIASWIYHRSLVTGGVIGSVRNEPVRAYDYVILAATAVASIVGVTMLTAAALQLGDAERNVVLAGFTVAIVAMPLWMLHARTVTAHVVQSGLEELRSPMRRTALYGLLTAGVLTLLVSSMIALQEILVDVLDGAVARATLTENAAPIATVLVVAAATTGHLRLMVHDRRLEAELGPVDPPPPPPPEPTSTSINVSTSNGEPVALR